MSDLMAKEGLAASIPPLESKVLSLERRLQMQEQENESLRRRVTESEERLQAFQQIAVAIGSQPTLDTVLQLIMEKTTLLMRADRSTLYVLDEANNELWSRIAQGSRISMIRLPVGEGIAGWVAKTGKSLNIKDAYRDERFNNIIDSQTGYQTRSCLCQPIRDNHRNIIGVIQVLNKVDGYFSVEDEALLSSIAAQAAITLENQKLYMSVVAKNMELTEAHEKLQQKIREIDILYEIEREAVHADSLEAFLHSIGTKCTKLLDSEACAITLRNETRCHVYLTKRQRDQRAAFTVQALDHEEGAAARVLRSGETLRVDTVDDDLVDPVLASSGVVLRTLMAVPLLADDLVIGVLEVVNRRGRDEAGRAQTYSRSELKLLTLIASHTSSAVSAQMNRERAEKAQRLSAIGQMLSSVLHDLKTPISIISGYVQLMARQEKAAIREQHAEAILKQFDTLNKMTKEVLSFAKGESTILLRKVLLNKFVEEVKELLQNDLMGRNVALVFESHYRGAARFDEVKLKRVFANLARNAAEAMPQGGTLHIRVEKVDHELCFTFADTGRGIPAEVQQRIFESFVTKGKSNGTGLGLAIVKKIVDEHRGRITYETQEDAGTVFRIALPFDPGD